MLNWPGLESAREAYRVGWQHAAPFPHVVIDGLFTPEALADLQATFPVPDATWADRRHLHSQKRTLADLALMPRAHRAAITELNGPAFRQYLRALSGGPPLVADPALYGGGLHRTALGGFLDIHADFTDHPVLKLRRVLNVLIYLTRDYRAAWGGALELAVMDGGRPRVVTSIHPVANRAVVFATSTQSWHGHTVKWAGPEPRTSIALYYYAAVTGDGILPTTDYRPTTGQYYKRARKAVGRCLRAVGLR